METQWNKYREWRNRERRNFHEPSSCERYRIECRQLQRRDQQRRGKCHEYRCDGDNQHPADDCFSTDESDRRAEQHRDVCGERNRFSAIELSMEIQRSKSERWREREWRQRTDSSAQPCAEFERRNLFRCGEQCGWRPRSEEHTSELQSRFGISYAV